jgi:hypothetical protein
MWMGLFVRLANAPHPVVGLDDCEVNAMNLI